MKRSTLLLFSLAAFAGLIFSQSSLASPVSPVTNLELKFSGLAVVSATNGAPRQENTTSTQTVSAAKDTGTWLPIVGVLCAVVASPFVRKVFRA